VLNKCLIDLLNFHNFILFVGAGIEFSYWTSATRVGCAGKFEFCFHNKSETETDKFFWDLRSMHSTGGCLAIEHHLVDISHLRGRHFNYKPEIVHCASSNSAFACQVDKSLTAMAAPPDKSVKYSVLRKFGFYIKTILVERKLRAFWIQFQKRPVLAKGRMSAKSV